MKQKWLFMVFAWLAMATSLPCHVNAAESHKYIYMKEGDALWLTASPISYAQYDVGAKTWYGATSNIVVLSSDDYSARILALSPGSAQITHHRVYYNNGQGHDYTYYHITISSNTNGAPVITPSTERTKVEKGTVLKLTSSLGATIYYSTSGSVTPGKSSTFPSSGITINSNTTVRAQAWANGYALSSVFNRTYEVVKGDFETTVAGGRKIFFKILSEADKTCQVYFVSGETGATLRIPSTIDGYRVTSIASQALMEHAELTTITLPSTLTSIGAEAFRGCTGLTSIALPATLTSIGAEAFRGCTGLTSVTIPDNVSSLGSRAFYDCTSLSSVHLPESLTAISNETFSYCSQLQTVNIPEGVTTIGELAFFVCKSLTSVTIPHSVTTIERAAFSGCIGLTSVDIPEGVTTIGEFAFEGCRALASINIPSSVTTIGSSAFQSCRALTSIDIPSSVTSIGSSVFSGCSSLATVSVDCKEVGAWFAGLTSIEKVVLGTEVEKIGEGAFAGCTGLTDVAVPYGVTTIDDKAFSGCTGLTTVTLRPYLTTIGMQAFAGCTGLKYISLPYTVTMLGSEAFMGCTSLSGVYLSSSMTAIGSGTFSGCSQLQTVKFPSGLTAVGPAAFKGCVSLSAVELPTGLADIATEAFAGCTSLTEITLPRTLTSIGSKAFAGCPDMNVIRSHIIVPFAMAEDVFTNYDSPAVLYVPKGTAESYWSTTGWIRFENIEEMESHESYEAYFAFRAALARRYDEMTSLSSDEYSGVNFGSSYYDGGIYSNYSLHKFADNIPFYALSDVYNGLLIGIDLCNEAIEGLDEGSTDVPMLRAARAFYTFLLMDNWGDTPIIDHVLADDEAPARSPRADVARWIESELLSVRDDCPSDVGSDTYGLPTRWMVDALLAKLYINWPVYTKDVTANGWSYGENEKLNDCVDACDDIIGSGRFDLSDDFKAKFLYNNGAHIKDFIYAMPYDAELQQGMTYARYRTWRMAHRGNGQFTVGLSSQPSGNFALNPEYSALFCLDNDRRNDCIIGDGTKDETTVFQYDAYTGEKTSTVSQYEGKDVVFSRSIALKDNDLGLNVGSDVAGYSQGYRSIKFFPYVPEVNGYSRNQSNDVPIFRYADVLLTKCEAVLRGADATRGDSPLSLFNQVRTAANAPLLSATPTLHDLLDERGRELLDEHWRRNDLIRFGEFERDWGHKNTLGGADAKKPHNRIFPLGAAVLNDHSEWKQNRGYGQDGDIGTGIVAVGHADTSAKVYSLSGQRRTALQKGINIVGGRKVVK